MKKIKINTATIRLDQLLKWANIAATGGEAKLLIQGGQVLVNGRVEKRRSVKVKPGDSIETSAGDKWIIGREP